MDEVLPTPDATSPIRVLFCCNPGYFQHLAAAIASLLRHNAQHRIQLHVAVSETDVAAERRLLDWLAPRPGVTLQIHRFDWGGVQWPTAFHISQDTYVRLFAPEFLDHSIDKVLYLDADLLVLDDLQGLWATDLSAHAVAAAPDPFGSGRKAALGLAANDTYVNAGVLLMNLDLWRRERLTDRLSRYIEASGPTLTFHDQDALNAVLRERIKVLDVRWNLQAKTLRPPRGVALAEPESHRRAAARPGVLHYASARKPWLFTAAVPRKSLYFRYLRETPWGGAAPLGRRLSSLPEHLFNHLLFAAGLDYDWDRVRRATRAGRALDRLLRPLAPRRERLGSQKIAPTAP